VTITNEYRPAAVAGRPLPAPMEGRGSQRPGGELIHTRFIVRSRPSPPDGFILHTEVTDDGSCQVICHHSYFGDAAQRRENIERILAGALHRGLMRRLLK
jgi:hypothetical protein